MKKALALLAAALACACVSPPAFESFPKIDAHFHLNTADPAVVEFAERHGFRLMTLVTGSASREEIDRELAWASAQHRARPRTVAYATTFSMEGWGEDGWAERTVERLRQDLAGGKLAVIRPSCSAIMKTAS
mgnify:FL=1